MNCGIQSVTVMMSMLVNSFLNIYLWIFYSIFLPKRVINWNNIDDDDDDDNDNDNNNNNNNTWITAVNTSCKPTRELYVAYINSNIWN